ncbi:hypothetical protein BGZ76_005224 [Entomortierella beljakovae]|nr:hypothetical protein BGZ76_005224 [Entomortierella beljakovae]
MALLGFNLSASSTKVEFLPTSNPENRRRVLKASHVLRQLPPDSPDIFAKDKWERYLERPINEIFDDITYPDFYKQYRQVFTVPAVGAAEAGDPVYFDQREPTPRIYRKYRQEHTSLSYTRPAPFVNVEETCMYVLMMTFPTRIDTDEWLEEFGVESYFQLAWNHLGPERMSQIQPLLQGGDGLYNYDNLPPLKQSQ